MAFIVKIYESDYLDMLPEQESKLPPKDDAFYDMVFEGGERGYKLHGGTAVPCIAPVQQVDLRTVPDRLLAVFAELIQGVIETSECQPDFVLDGYGLPAFLEPTLHISDEIRVFQSLYDFDVISRDCDVGSREIVG